MHPGQVLEKFQLIMVCVVAMTCALLALICSSHFQFLTSRDTFITGVLSGLDNVGYTKPQPHASIIYLFTCLATKTSLRLKLRGTFQT